MRFEVLSSLQRAITALLTTYEPEFIRIGWVMFLAFATVLIVWQGIRMMLSTDSLGEHMFGFAKLLLYVSFGYAMIAYYESPLPGIGTSFSNLITDQAHFLAHILDAKSIERTYDHLDELWRRFLQPDAWALLPNLLYWTLLIVVLAAKILSLAIVAFSLIASAVCGLLGPIFIPFFITPKLDWLYWSWLKSFIQYSFVQVVTYAYFMVFENFLFEYLTQVPYGIHEGSYPNYAATAIVVIGAFIFGVLLIPSLTSSLFSGRGGESVLPSQVRI